MTSKELTKVQLGVNEQIGCRFCLKCGSDAVWPSGSNPEDHFEQAPQFGEEDDMDGDWDCECGHTGPVGLDIILAGVPYYKVVSTMGQS